MPNSEKHQRGLEEFQNGAYDVALQLLSEALLENENCELWNDWATAQAARGQLDEAKKGYRRALQMNINDSQSAANLGVLLLNEGQVNQALPLLEKSLMGLDELQRQAVQELLDPAETPGRDARPHSEIAGNQESWSEDKVGGGTKIKLGRSWR